MGGGHKNDQVKCRNYDVEIEYEGKVGIRLTDFGDKICCLQHNPVSNNKFSPFIIKVT